jgi:starch phosphorylase
VAAAVDLAGLDPGHVRVEVLHGIVGTDGEFRGTPRAVVLQPAGRGLYRGDIVLTSSGSYGVTARVLPVHDALASPYDLGLATWAKAQ